MGSLLAELVPFALGLVVTPAAIATGIVFLSSRRPVANALAFAAPFAVVYALLSTVVVGASQASTEPLVSEHDKHVAALIVGLLLLALGGLSVLRRHHHDARAVSTGPTAATSTAPHGATPLTLAAAGVSAAATTVQPGASGRRTAAAPAKRGLLARIDSAGPPQAFAIGLVVSVLNPNLAILLGGLAAIAAADVPGGTRFVGAGFLVLASEVGLLGPVLWYVAFPESAARGLRWARRWLASHEHAVDLAVLLTFGVVFTVKGLSGL